MPENTRFTNHVIANAKRQRARAATERTMREAFERPEEHHVHADHLRDRRRVELQHHVPRNAQGAERERDRDRDVENRTTTRY